MYDYLLIFNVYMTDLLLLPFFWFRILEIFRIIPFQYILLFSAVINVWVVYDSELLYLDLKFVTS